MWRILLANAMLLFFSGCAMTRAPLYGALYTGVASGNSVSAQAGPKMGESCAMALLGIIAFGDASIDTARKAGGITSISIVDEKSTNVLFGLYQQYCTIVHGK